MGRLATWSEVAKIIESAAAIGGLIVAGWWFIEQRENYPRADLSQSASAVSLHPGLFAIEANIEVKNEGRKQLKLHRARVMVQAVSASPFNYDQLATVDGPAYWGSVRPISTPDAHQFQDGELRWPVVRMFDGPIDHHVEPGETDNIIFTFLIPCSRLQLGRMEHVRTLRIATDLFKPTTEEGKDFAWKAREFVDISKECNR